MQFLMILSDPEIARYICRDKGVTPMVDLERLGKAERQGHLGTWKSQQDIEDVSRIRGVVGDAELLVRIDPFHDGTKAQLDEVIARGADAVMLPMFHDIDTLARFLDLLGDRAEPVPLFETARSVAALPDMVKQLGLRRLHIGLNDLHLDLGDVFLFEPLANGYLEEPCAALRNAGVRFGIGGLARAREGIVSPEFLLGEHVRLGSTAAILSQTFHRNPENLAELKKSIDFPEEMARLRAIYQRFLAMDAEGLEHNRVATRDRVFDVAQLIRARKGDES